jgi:hypothetical protein
VCQERGESVSLATEADWPGVAQVRGRARDGTGEMRWKVDSQGPAGEER